MARALSTVASGAALFLVIALASARAEARDVAIESFLPAPDQAGFVGFAGTRTPGSLGVDATLWLDYGLHPYAIRGPNPVDHRFDGTVAVQLGILSRGAVALRMPVLLYQSSERDVSGAFAFPVARAGAGNPAVDARVRLLGASVRPDGSVQDGAGLALRGIVHLPVGTSSTHFADDQWRTELAVISDIEMFGIGAGLSLAYRHRFDDAQPSDGEFAHVIRIQGGLRLPLPLISRALPGRLQEAGLIELDVGTPARDFFAKSKTPIELRVGYRVIVGDLYGTLSVGAGLTDAPGQPDLRALLGVGWSPRQHDQDADGVPDRADQCVHLPEDRDGFQDEDGCADDDNDGDLIVDEDDRCPLAPAEMDRDEDEDGCTDP